MKFAGGASGEISAAIFGTGQVGVVVSNTIVGRACDLLPWARELATQGYRVMLFDYSALMPTTDIPAAVDLFAKDTVEAAAKLRELGVQKVVLISGSVGGLGALRAGLDDKPAPTVSSACRRLARTRSRNPCGGWRSLSSSWLPTTTFVPMIAWRVAWVVAPGDLVNDLSRVQIYNGLVPSGFAQIGVRVALGAPEEDLAAANAEWQRRRDETLRQLDGLPVVPAAGGWSLLLDVAALELDCVEVSDRLLEHKVAATPMRGWGGEVADRHVRFVFSNEPVHRLALLGTRVRAALAAARQRTNGVA